MNNEIPAIGEIFIPLDQYPCVYDNEPIRTGISQLLEHCSADGQHLYFDGLLVINAADQLVGQISYTDIMKILFPAILTPVKPKVFAGKNQRYTDLSILLEGSFSKACRRQATVTASQCMIAPPPAITTGTHLLHALEILVSNGHNSLPVIENQTLMGVVRLADVFKTLSSYCTLEPTNSQQSATVL